MRKSTLFLLIWSLPYSLSFAASLPDRYSAVAARIIAAAEADTQSMARLQYLCDRIGNRVSGSPSLERAIEWSAEEMRKAGLDNVQTPPVMVPKWVRGKESAVLLWPLEQQLPMMGFGMSVGTPPGGITAEVVPVEDLQALKSLTSAQVTGKFVLFTQKPGATTYHTDEYKDAIGSGPVQAAAKGAVGVLVRDSFSLQHPRTTGMAPYPAGARKIPVAGISQEDALMMKRLAEAGTPARVRLTMEARQEPDSPSHNVMGELRGREKPEEIVVLGGHIDTWDVGQGASDDGAGMMTALEAVLLLKKLGLQPRRTIRVVFWVNEENGGAGGRAYRAMIGSALKNHVAGIEVDHGAEKPAGYGFGAADQDRLTPGAFRRATEIGALLKSFDGESITPRGGGGDLRPLALEGVPTFGSKTVDIVYSDLTHTTADTFDKIDPREFRRHVASAAVMAYVLADMPERLTDLQ